jgi:hypothetical protein
MHTDPDAPYGRKLDGEPKKRPGGRPPDYAKRTTHHCDWDAAELELIRRAAAALGSTQNRVIRQGALNLIAQHGGKELADTAKELLARLMKQS